MAILNAQAVTDADVELVGLREEEKVLSAITSSEQLPTEPPLDKEGKKMDLDACHARLVEVGGPVT